MNSTRRTKVAALSVLAAVLFAALATPGRSQTPFGSPPGGYGPAPVADQPPPPDASAKFYGIKYRPVREIAHMLAVAGNFGAAVGLDELNNRIVVVGTPEQQERIKSMIDQLDIAPPKHKPLQANVFFLECDVSSAGGSDDAAIAHTWVRLTGQTLPEATELPGSIGKAFEWFAGQGLNVLVQWQNLEAEGVVPDSEVNFQYLTGIKNASLKVVLKALLESLSPEARYVVDENGVLVIGVRGALPENHPPLPDGLVPVAKALAANGFAAARLLTPVIVRTEQGEEFAAQGTLVTPLSDSLMIEVGGRATLEEDLKTARVNLHASISQPQMTGVSAMPGMPRSGGGPGGPVGQNQVFQLSTAVAAPIGEYVVLAGISSSTPAFAPADKQRATVAVLRIDLVGDQADQAAR